MKEILSYNNKTAKLVRKLKDKKYRDAEDLYLVEGFNVLKDAVESKADIVLIGIDSSKLSRNEDVSEFLKDRKDLKDKTYSFSAEVFESLTDTVSPQGVLAVIRKGHKDLCGGRDRFIILDELQDPGNVGTIIRTAEAAGFTGVMGVKGTADMYSPKVVRSAAGSLFRIGISQYENREDMLKFIEDRNIDLYACDGNGGTSYTAADLRENIAIVIGNEGSGLSGFFAENSRSITIPMKAETESLNAAVAAGIVIYESVRQNNSEIGN